MAEGKFSLYWTDKDGGTHTEYKFVDAEKVNSGIQRLCAGPAAKMGIVKEVIVSDIEDYCCFLWQKGKIIFPTKDDLDKLKGVA